ncbi:MAG: M18 family aminopeptidase [SAR324 cluster bacterium]|nr:M18 family aminopeptidase [SAR324 cluster bacterium]MBF0352533.1 M18 family aminopeptidase [SAR324 cluster bacterium]
MSSDTQSVISTQALMNFLDESPTPFHAVESLVQRLRPQGFEELKETDSWKLEKGGRYFVSRGGGSLIAWIQNDKPAEQGFRIIGAHTDSPNLRIKPNPNISQQEYWQLGVEEYGGVILASWTDRDLSLAGQVFTANQDSSLQKHLVRFDEPLLRIPLLAIHLNREVNTKGLILNKQTQILPVFSIKQSNDDKQADILREWLGENLHVAPQDILGFDLCLYDVQKSALTGKNKEFLVSSRIDNLFSCFCALTALQGCADEKHRQIPVMACFDHEEIGSMTDHGARSSFLKSVLTRVVQHTHSDSLADYERSMAHSLMISADMAHAVHPSFSDKHDAQHFPHMNQGPVIKVNVKGNYATSGATQSILENLARKEKIPVQRFVSRGDLACGSTIGPYVSGDLGIPTADIGAAMLSMHSIREMCGSHDTEFMIRLMRSFYLHS